MTKKRRAVNDTCCTADNPMPAGLSKEDERRWTHPDCVRTYEGSLYDEYTCPHCDTQWKASKER